MLKGEQNHIKFLNALKVFDKFQHLSRLKRTWQARNRRELSQFDEGHASKTSKQTAIFILNGDVFNASSLRLETVRMSSIEHFTGKIISIKRQEKYILWRLKRTCKTCCYCSLTTWLFVQETLRSLSKIHWLYK